jgi:putative flippase GtrA
MAHEAISLLGKPSSVRYNLASMTSALSESLAFLRQNDLKTIFARIKTRDVPGLIQFALYTFCGGIATASFLGIVVVLSKTLIPAYENTFVAGESVKFFGYDLCWLAPVKGAVNALAINDGIRAKNLLVNNCIAFLITNVIAYVTNVLIVFKSGRHHPVIEFLMFTLISSISFGISQSAGPYLVQKFGLPTNLAILSNVAASILLNFAGRKFFVFKA